MAANEKISQLDTSNPLVGDEVSVIVQSGDNKKVSINEIAAFSLFKIGYGIVNGVGSVPGTYVSSQDAIDAGCTKIIIDGDIVESGVLVLDNDVELYFLDGSSLTVSRINIMGNNILVFGQNDGNSIIKFTDQDSSNDLIYGGSFLQIVQFYNIKIDLSSVSKDNCSLCLTSNLVVKQAVGFCGSGIGPHFSFMGFRSECEDFVISGSYSLQNTNMAYMYSRQFGMGRNITIDLSQGCSSTLPVVSIGQNSSLDSLIIIDGSNPQTAKISIAGVVQNLSNQSSSTINVDITGNNSIVIFNGDLNGGTVDIGGGSTNPVNATIDNLTDGNIIIESTANIVTVKNSKPIVYTNHSSTRVYRTGNNEVIGNDYDDAISTISQFTGEVDGVGVGENHYLTIKDAYDSNSQQNIVSSNVTESSSTVMLPADYLCATVNPGCEWSLGSFQVNGSGLGENFVLNLNGHSSFFSWSTPGIPFLGFDSLSSLVLNLNGGILQNTSSSNNSYLYSQGFFRVNNGKLLLANVSGSGIKSSTHSIISGVEFVGGGSSCDRAIICGDSTTLEGGGIVRDYVVSGVFSNNAVIIDCVQPTSLYSGIINIETPCIVNVNGSCDGIKSIGSGPLALSPASNSTITNPVVDSILINPNVTNVTIINPILTGAIYLSSDNSNSNIKVIGGSASTSCEIYGSNIKFDSFDFNGSFIIDPSSTGAITGSTSSLSVSIPSGIELSGNDENIGNNYSDFKKPIFVTTDTLLTPNETYILTSTAASFTLPSSFSLGDFFEIIGSGSTNTDGIFHIVQNSGQQIFFDSRSTSIGTAGYIESTQNGGQIKMVAISSTSLRVISTFDNLNSN